MDRDVFEETQDRGECVPDAPHPARTGGGHTGVSCDPADHDHQYRSEIASRIEHQAEALIALARSLRRDARSTPTRPALPLDAHVFAEIDWSAAAERAYRERRRRDAIFADPDLFGEPAWDMLLDLTLSELQGRKLSITSACIGACVPLTTALRWLGMLERKGFVMRENDARDGRRAFVRISPDGFRKVLGWLSSLARSDGA